MNVNDNGEVFLFLEVWVMLDNPIVNFRSFTWAVVG
jgi:hypothetical protein